MRKKRKLGFYRKDAYEAYVLWCSIPRRWRGKVTEELNEMGFSGHDIDDKVARIRTQTEFAKVYNIKDLGTLTRWNRRINETGLELTELRKWAGVNTKDVIFALYQKVIETGDSKAARLWLQVVHGWVPPSNFRGKAKRTPHAAKIMVIDPKDPSSNREAVPYADLKL